LKLVASPKRVKKELINIRDPNVVVTHEILDRNLKYDIYYYFSE